MAVMIDASDVCCCVQFFGAGKDPSYLQYTGELPGGVRFEHSRDVARTIMGLLVRSSDGGAVVAGIEHRPWDLFTCDGLNVHFEYAGDYERILMVSITRQPTTG